MTLIEDFVFSILKVQTLFASVIQAFSTELSKNLIKDSKKSKHFDYFDYLINFGPKECWS